MKTSYTKTLGALALATLLVAGIGAALAGPGGFGPGGCNGFGGGPGYGMQGGGYGPNAMGPRYGMRGGNAQISSERLETLESGLSLTEDQKPLWAGFKEAVKDRDEFRATRRASHEPGLRWTLSPEEFREFRTQNQEAMLENRTAVHNAGKALLASLNDAQKEALKAELPFLGIIK